MSGSKIREHKISGTDVCMALAAIASALLLIFGATQSQAQTLTVLHTFTGEADGAQPIVGLTMDRAGNLYGTTTTGGPGGYGTVFKLTRRDSGWQFSTLYAFRGGADGAEPQTRVIFGPDGALYGTANMGGGTGCGYSSCGVVFNLRPPSSACKTALCYWTENVIYNFNGTEDTFFPIGAIAFDSQGRLYGLADLVYQLTPSSGQWTLNVIGGRDIIPNGGVALDAAGNVYSTSYPDLIYRLVPSGSQWLEQDVYTFNGQTQGYGASDLTLDQAGNVYGGNAGGGQYNGGTVFELSPGNGGWNVNLLHAFSGSNGLGGPSWGALTLDSAGNVYGANEYDGLYNVGSAFKLTPSDGGWVYTDLHDFHANGSDGCFPNNSMAVDASGNLYGTTYSCGGGYGVVFEITP